MIAATMAAPSIDFMIANPSVSLFMIVLALPTERRRSRSEHPATRLPMSTLARI
jgi:hypothetical protein